MDGICTPLGRWFADKPQGLLRCVHTLPGKTGDSKVVANCKFLSDQNHVGANDVVLRFEMVITCVMNSPGDIAAKEAGAYSLESRWLVERSTDIVNSNL